MPNQPKNSHIFALLPTLDDYNRYRTALGCLHVEGVEPDDEDFFEELQHLLDEEYCADSSTAPPPVPATAPFPFTIQQLRSVAPAITREVQRRREEGELDSSREAAWLALRHVRTMRPTERRPMRARRTRRQERLQRRLQEQRGRDGPISVELPRSQVFSRHLSRARRTQSAVSLSLPQLSQPAVGAALHHGVPSSALRQGDWSSASAIQPMEGIGADASQSVESVFNDDGWSSTTPAAVSQLVASRQRLRAAAGIDPLAAVHLTSTTASLAHAIGDAERAMAALTSILQHATRARESTKEATALLSEHERCCGVVARPWPVYPASVAPVSLPDWLQDVLPGHQCINVEGDGRCWLRCICMGVEPDKPLTEERLDQVRHQLHDQLCRWGAHRWMQHVPLYSLRDMLVADLSATDPRTSYDVYKQYLSEPAYLRKHLDHAVFYLASSLFDVEFIIVARLQGTSHHPLVYHRRINEAVRAKRTIVVAHYSDHYELVDGCTDDALGKLLQLPLLTSWGKAARDTDYERLQRQAENSQDDDERKQEMVLDGGDSLTDVMCVRAPVTLSFTQPTQLPDKLSVVGLLKTNEDVQRVSGVRPAGDEHREALQQEQQRQQPSTSTNTQSQAVRQYELCETKGVKQHRSTPRHVRRSKRLSSVLEEDGQG